MARLYRAVCVALCLTAVFSVMALALPPDGCRLFCSGGHTTAVNGGASDWGMGSTCTEAQTAFSNAVRSKASSYCAGLDPEALGYCNLTEVITGGCFFNGTMFQVDGYANFGCRFYVCP